MTQPTLFDTKFEEYHRKNPQVFEMFKRFTFQKINQGVKRLGASAVAERIRWETSVGGDDGFKINNNYRAYYARLFMQKYPEHAGLFQLRTSKADKELLEDQPDRRAGMQKGDHNSEVTDAIGPTARATEVK